MLSKLLNFFGCLLFLFSSLYIYPQCNFRTSDFIDELSNPSYIKKIEINIPKTRKWAVNGLEILKDENPIKPKYKKRFKARITAIYSFGSCEFDAKIRQNGDLKDHIAFQDGKIFQSIDVKLESGNIASAVRFKLLIPKTRGGKNEIFATILLRELGFISPLSFFVNTSINGTEAMMIFQENIVKEMLERNNRREGPIFEGDESYIWNYKNFDNLEMMDIHLIRLVNQQWAEKGSTSSQIAYEAFNQLQKTHLQESKNYDLLNREQVLFQQFQAIMIALGGNHGLATHNRKYYFNSLNQIFEPLYYDGNIKLFLEDDSSIRRMGFQRFSKQSIQIIESKISTIDLKDLILKFSNQTSSSIEDSRLFINDSLAALLINLDTLKKDINDFNYINELENFVPEDVSQALGNYLTRLKKIDFHPQVFIKIGDFNPGINQDYLKCDLDMKCSEISLRNSQVNQIISQGLFEKKEAMILPNTFENQKRDFNEINFLNGKLTSNKIENINIDYSSKTITFSQSNEDDWLLIKNIEINDWNINFYGAELNSLSEQRFNKYGLTGCVTIYNASITNLSFYSVNAGCEDALNIINSSGTVKDITIIKSSFDGLDMDFSKIEVDQILVRESKNDCIDLSGGEYFFHKIINSYCGDKGISVGERSIVTTLDLNAQDSNIVLASKDLSIVNVNNFVGSKSNYCVEIFQKKEEFGGSRVIIENYSCSSPNKVDESTSRLSIKNVL